MDLNKVTTHLKTESFPLEEKPRYMKQTSLERHKLDWYNAVIWLMFY
jgi:hypothetical protein